MLNEFARKFYNLKARAERQRESEGQSGSTAVAIHKPVSEYAYRKYVADRPPIRAAICLEVGVGSGWAMHDMINAGCGHVDGIDISEERLEQAGTFLRSLGFQNFSLRLDDAESLSTCPDNHYEYANYSDVLEHVMDATAAIRSLRRVLKKGSKVYIKTPNNFTDMELKLHHHCDRMLRRLLGETESSGVENELMLRDDLKRLSAEEQEELKSAAPAGFHEHVHQFEPDELIDFLQTNGFTIEKLTGLPIFSDIFYQHELELPLIAEFYAQWVAGPGYAEFTNRLHRDLGSLGRRKALENLPPDYVFSDNLVVVASKN